MGSECEVKVSVNVCMSVTFFAPQGLALPLFISSYFQGRAVISWLVESEQNLTVHFHFAPKPFNEVINPANRKLSPLCNAEVHNLSVSSAAEPQQTV